MAYTRASTKLFVLSLLVDALIVGIQVQIGIVIETDKWDVNTTDLVREAVQNAYNQENITLLDSYELVEKANSFRSAEAAKFLDSQSRTLAIPQVVLTKTSCRMESVGNYTFHFQPSYTIEGLLIAELTTYNTWIVIALVYDSSVDPLVKQEILLAVSQKYARTLPLGIGTDQEPERTRTIGRILGRIKEANLYNVFVCATEDNAKTILQMASVEGMLTKEYKWILMMDAAPHSFANSVNHGNSNLVVVRRNLRDVNDSNPLCHDPTNMNSKNRSGSAVMDLTVFDGVLSLAKALNSASGEMNLSSDGNINCQNKPFSKMEYGELISSKLKQVSFDGMTGQVAFDDQNYPLEVQYEVCSTYAASNSTLYNMGYWSSLHGLKLNKEQLFKNTFKDFSGQNLLIGSLESAPYVITTTVDNKTKYTGFCIDVLNELASRFKFNYTIIEPVDQVWGARNSDGSWNGVVGMLTRGEVAFGVGPLTITALRESVVDFTKPLGEDGSGIITKKPSDDSGQMFKMFQPFAAAVWGCIVLTVLVVGVGLYVVRRFSPYTACNRKEKNASADEISLLENMWLIYGSYMEQGGEPRPTSISGRCILGFWWLFTILMASTYTANLAAFLTVSIAEQPINSLSELVKQDDITPIIKSSGNLESLFKEARSGIYKDVWRLMLNSPAVTTTKEALEYVKQGTHAFMTDRSQLEYTVLNDCNIYALADEIFNTAGYGFILPENAPFMEAFNFNIMKMQEAGLMDKWKQKWWPSSDRCSVTQRTSTANILGLDSLAGPFLIYLCVTMVAVGCLLLEVVLRSPNNRCLSKNRVQAFGEDEADEADQTAKVQPEDSK